MRHYEIVFMVHPDQSEQVPGMIQRYTDLYHWCKRSNSPFRRLGSSSISLPNQQTTQSTLRSYER